MGRFFEVRLPLIASALELRAALIAQQCIGVGQKSQATHSRAIGTAELESIAISE